MAIHVKSSGGMPLCRPLLGHRSQEALFVEEWVKLSPLDQCSHCKAEMGLSGGWRLRRQKLDAEEEAKECP